jgi:hypothetical protein
MLMVVALGIEARKCQGGEYKNYNFLAPNAV